ncbi:MAG: hypothetical protein ACYC1V_30705 [Pirellulaceae bacterium]
MAVLLAMLILPAFASADTIGYGDSLGANSAGGEVNSTGVLDVWKRYVNNNAIDMTVTVADPQASFKSVEGVYAYDVTERITNNAGAWTDFKWIVSPDSLTNGMTIMATSDLSGTGYKFVGDSFGKQIKIEREDGFITKGTTFSIAYSILTGELPSTGPLKFTVQAVDGAPLGVPAPTASVGLVGLFSTLLIFGARRNRRSSSQK